MSVNTIMEAKVHQELVYFLAKHSLEKTVSNIDEIILSYLVGVVELITRTADDDVLDVVELMEMLNAYLPGFDKIGRSEVIDWMFGLTSKLMASIQDNVLKDAGSSVKVSEDDELPESSRGVNGHQDFVVKGKEFPIYDYSQMSCTHETERVSISCTSKSISSSHKNTNLLASSNLDDLREDDGRNSDHVKFISSPHCKKTPSTTTSVPDKQNLQPHSKHRGSHISCPAQDHQCDSSETNHLAYEDTQVRLLLEMFPAACSLEARHCFQLSAGDMDQAAQLILDRQDKGQAFLDQANSSIVGRKNHFQMDKLKKKSDSKLNDQCVKSCVLEKYSFVDTEEDKRTYHPLAHKEEAKKLVRYRDGQVVSMKGERFSNVEKKEEDDLKHTYVNLKPARKYRFH